MGEETCYIILSGAGRNDRTWRIAQLMAINEQLKETAHKCPNSTRSNYVTPTGLCPVEVHWLGGLVFRLVCTVAADASQSPLLAAHRKGQIVESARIHVHSPKNNIMHVNDERARASVPGRAWCSRLTDKPRDPRLAPKCLDHNDKLRMASVIIDHAVRTLCRTDQPRSKTMSEIDARPDSVFDFFWGRYLRGNRFLEKGGEDGALLLEHRAWWRNILSPGPAEAATPVRPQELDHDTREAEWPQPAPVVAAPPNSQTAVRAVQKRATAARKLETQLLPGALLPQLNGTHESHREPFTGLVTPAMLVEAAHMPSAPEDDRVSTVSSSSSSGNSTAVSEAGTILKMSLRLDDIENLWSKTVGNPDFGGVWSGGPSPVERKYFGIKDVSDSCGPWSKVPTALFTNQQRPKQPTGAKCVPAAPSAPPPARW